MKVDIHSGAEAELNRLPESERYAIFNAFEKLATFGDQLPFPHSSKVKDAPSLRELRPRAGRSQWRAFYRRIGDAIVIGAIGPEARVDPRGFRHAVQQAVERLDEIDHARPR